MNQYSFKEVEAAIYQEWEKNGYFTADEHSHKPPFTIVIPPPNITGILHMGHALNNTLQDVLIRYNRLNGCEVLWMPGTDHAGIATQNVVEKNLAKQGLTRDGVGREKFLTYLWEWTNKYGSTIINQLKKLGAHADWSRARFTMDERYSGAVREVFVALYEKGLIYRGNYIINWCPRCKTALSDEEAPHKELDGWLYYIQYPIEYAGKKEFVTVATTRPETMLGDTAVAHHPDDTRYAHLKNAVITVPIVQRRLKIIQDPMIDPQFGTGLVKVTPAHDKNDFIMAKKHHAEFVNIMHDDASLNENAKEYQGMDRFQARKLIVERLSSEGLLLKKEPYKLNAGHCYRCNTIVEPRLSLQWFVKMKPLSLPAIDAVKKEKVTFYPPRWEKVYLNWMENIEDWCISRQIWWGHRIPVWYCRTCTSDKSQDTMHKTQATSETEDRGQMTDEKYRGVIVAKEAPKKCPDCGSTDLIQDNDVLDTWFSSWLWPFATMGWPQEHKQSHGARKSDLDYFYPTNVLVTASEILFFWVARMIMASLEFMKEIPFKHVLIHGTVRDERGIKMSKSLGNTIDPLEIIDKYGADALRFSLMMCAASGADVFLSEEKFVVGRNFANKVWNAFKYSLTLLAPHKETLASSTNMAGHCRDFRAEDFWIMKELGDTQTAFREQLKEYRLNDAVKTVYEFFWHRFCDWYIEMSKVSDSPAAPRCIFIVFIETLKMLHPFMPFMTEYLFKEFRSQICLDLPESILKTTYTAMSVDPSAAKHHASIQKLIDFIGVIRSVKKYLDIPSTEKIYLEAQGQAAEDGSLIDQNKKWIMNISRLSDLQPRSRDSIPVFSQSGFTIYFKESSDKMNTYRNNLILKIKKVEDMAGHYKRKLADEQFVSRAPAELVAQQRQKLDEVTADLEMLKKIGDYFG